MGFPLLSVEADWQWLPVIVLRRILRLCPHLEEKCTEPGGQCLSLEGRLHVCAVVARPVWAFLRQGLCAMALLAGGSDQESLHAR